MREDRFDRLLEAHVAALTGSLIDGVEAGPDGAAYVFSRTIPDPTLNFAVRVRAAEQLAWAQAAARTHGRDPAFLARHAQEAMLLQGLVTPAAVFPARWMTARIPHGAPPADDEVRLARHAAPAPPPDFEAVFAALSHEAGVQAHLRARYLPALRAARGRPGVRPLHLVLYDEAGPAACASLYLLGSRAGLYSVSTRADRQRRGHGARITQAALHAAGEHGAAEVFLQCPAEGPVPALYRRVGFRTACSPLLLCTVRP